MTSPLTTPIMKSTNSLLLVALTVILVACGGGGTDKKAELEQLKKAKSDLEAKILTLEEEIAKTDTTSGGKPIEVVSVPLTPQIFKAYIEVQGRVDADENVSLSSEMPGTVSRIYVKVGDRVSKGQVLAETDQRAQLQQLADLQTNYELARQIYEKQKNLWDQKIGTEVAFLQAKANKESVESKIAMMQEQIRMGKIISPIDGTVDLLNLKVGQAVAPGFGAITVVNFDNLKVKADVSESYAARIKNGDEVLVLFPDMKDSVVSKVHYASRAINALSRTFAVEVGLDTKKEYHPNTVAKLKINDYKTAQPVIVVPVKYVQKGENSAYVLVEEKGVAVKKDVVLGREYAGLAEVVSGLKEGDRMITDGYDLVNEGSNVISAKK